METPELLEHTPVALDREVLAAEVAPRGGQPFALGNDGVRVGCAAPTRCGGGYRDAIVGARRVLAEVDLNAADGLRDARRRRRESGGRRDCRRIRWQASIKASRNCAHARLVP